MNRNAIDLLQERNEAAPPVVKVVDFQVLAFSPPGRGEVVVIFALGEDGVIRELAGGRWIPYPIIPPDGP